MKKPKAARKPDSALPPPSLDEVATLLVASDTPPWLKKYLESWAPSLAIDRGVSAIQPTRVAMKKQLEDFTKAATLVERALTDTPFMEFLQGAGRAKFEGLGGLQQALRVIAQHAEAAARGPELTTEAGKTRSGRGKALPPGAISPKTFCAILIVEAWKFLHGNYPAPRSEGAAAAAHAYWLASGGTNSGWGENPHGAWRPIFEGARKVEATELRTDIQRRLRLHQLHD